MFSFSDETDPDGIDLKERKHGVFNIALLDPQPWARQILESASTSQTCAGEAQTIFWIYDEGYYPNPSQF